MSNTVIKVENLSKQYRLGNVGLGTIGDDLNRFYQTKLRRREDPYLKIGDENDRSQKATSDYVWALKNINFEVEQGQVLGIIGRNGAGKSTLLKILSRTTTPTTGSIKLKGRVASLLEVGTGFHPELTGRENIFLNGAILGMKQREVKSKFDEIVDFAGVERYIDTPVKRYSSGMYVRLAFGVAAYLEPDILIIDEVLAVGDAEFQKKALGKMKDVSGKDGRTVLFVSHHMVAIQTLCNDIMLLNNGLVETIGETNLVINTYLKKNFKKSLVKNWAISDAPGKEWVKLTQAQIKPQFESESENITINTPLLFELEFSVTKQNVPLSLAFEIHSSNGEHILTTAFAKSKIFEVGDYLSTCVLPAPLLNNGNYSVSIQVVKDNIELVDRAANVLEFEVIDTVRTSGYTGRWPGVIRPKLDWKTEVKKLHNIL